MLLVHGAKLSDFHSQHITQVDIVVTLSVCPSIAIWFLEQNRFISMNKVVLFCFFLLFGFIEIKLFSVFPWQRNLTWPNRQKDITQRSAKCDTAEAVALLL